MTSWVVWAVTVAVSGLIGFTATHFSVRTLRYVTAGTVIALLVAVTAYGQTPAGGKGPPDLETAFAFGADRLAGAWFRPLWALWSSAARARARAARLVCHRRRAAARLPAGGEVGAAPPGAPA